MRRLMNSAALAVIACAMLASAELFSLELRAPVKQALAEQALDVNKRELFIAGLSGCSFNDFDAIVSIGTPPQDLSVLMDTGSTTLAVVGPSCSTCNSVVTSHYTPSASSTSVSNGVSTSSTYLDNSGWSGSTYSDVVSIAGVPDVRMNFAVISKQTRFFGYDCAGNLPSPNQGIMGLAYSSIATVGTDSYPDKAAAAEVYSPDIFAIQMCESTGSITFGGYNASFATGEPTYVPLIPDDSGEIRYYTIQMNSVSTNQGDTLSTGPFPDVVVDSGTSILLLTTDVYNDFVDILNDDPDWPFSVSPASFFDGNSCPIFTGSISDLNNDLPSLVFSLGDPAETFTLKPVASYFLPVTQSGRTYLCPGIAANDDVNILGYPFMNQYLTIFDRESERVGFAPTDCTKAPLPSSTPVSTVVPGSASGVVASLAVTSAAVAAAIVALL